MFLVFLTLFSYVLLCDFYPIRHLNDRGVEIGQDIGLIEKIVIVWVCIFSIDALNQVN